MRKSIQNIVFVAIALCLAAACTQTMEPVVPQQGNGDYSVSLSVFCLPPGTKADIAGEDAYNENVLDYVDWFVFLSDTDTGDALVSGRDVPSGANNTLKTVCLDNWCTPSQRSFYVYAVANMPGVSDHSAMPTTLAGLKALEVTASFNNLPFTAQSSFVMRGGATVTFVDTDRKVAKSLAVSLQRLAAKLSMNLSVAPAIDELNTLPDGSQVYIKTWYPEVDAVDPYIVFLNASSTIEGTPITYDMDKFFTYSRGGFNAQYSYLHLDKSTYPYTFDYTGSPSATAALPSLPSGWEDDTALRWRITGTPYYTYPMTWATDSPQAPFIKVILKWTSYDETQGGTVPEERDADGKFIRAARSKPASFLIDNQKKFYYKIPLVPTSLDSGTLNPNDWLTVSADLAILGSTSDELPVILSGQYYVTDWGTGTSAAGDLKQASYLSLNRYQYEVFAQNDINIPVISSHDLTGVTDVTATYTDYSTATPTTQTLDPSEYSFSFDGNKSVTVSHVLHTDITSPDVECSRITYKFKVQNKAGLESREITVIQYPPIYITVQQSNANVFINGNANNFTSYYHSRFSNYYYNPIYDEGDEDYTWTPTFSTSMSYTDSRNVSLTFTDATNNGNNKELTLDDVITITAPDPYWIYQVQITYSGSLSEYSVTSTNCQLEYLDVIKTFQASSNKIWFGEAKSMRIRCRKSYGSTSSRYITGITVKYHNKNLLGTIANRTGNASAAGNPNMYTISVTDVSQLDFFIADTRSASGKDYPKLTASGVSGQLTDYHPLDTDPYNNNAIAPQIIVASTYGGSWGSGMRFESAEERCASFQENGYPAGRWRIPTDAEIMFIARLSANGKIPLLFNGNFWGSSGTQGQSVFADATTFEIRTSQVAASVRCVYPSWRWGGDPMSSYMTSWSGWQN